MNSSPQVTFPRPASKLRFVRLLVLTLVGQLLLVSPGCSPLMTAHKSSKWMWWKRDSEPQAPAKVTPMWTDTVLYQSGLAPIRGFGGRVMFFDGKSEKPIKVEGALTVYAFDGTSTNSSGTVPERKFIFPPEDLETHYSESKLGASYSFWLPWDEVGGYERRITLVTRFEPTSGTPTMSQPSRHYLPGLPAPEIMDFAERDKKGDVRSHSESRHAVQAASYTDAPVDPTIYPRMSTVTIDVPPNFVRRTQEQENSLDDLRRELGRFDAADVSARASDREESHGRGNGKPPKPWWEQGTTRGESSDGNPTDTQGTPAATGDAKVTETFQRRDQIRRQPHRGTWIPSLSPTPRSE